MSTPTLAVPQSLTDKYRPQTIADFVGLDKPKKILAKFAAQPYPSVWLFVGPSGIADEADRMTPAAQLALLSKLDATAFPPNTVFIFTCNSTDGLEPRFLSRCRVIEFSNYGMNGSIAEYLDKVWHAEGGNGNAPDLARLAKESRNNVRDALMKLEVELMAL
jgi:DNA polymerase III gamma/tau subunit